jgi:FAD synthase
MILLENALGGHINHIYDDPDMKFGDIKNIMVAAASGRLQGTEKIYGINANLTYSLIEKKAKLFRNKSQLASGGLDSQQVEQYYNEKDKQQVGQVFKSAIIAFEKFCQSLDKESIVELFGKKGEKVYNCEIVNGALPNLIHYNGNSIVFHLTGHRQLTSQGYEPSNLEDEIKYLSNYANGTTVGDYSIKVNRIISLKELENKDLLKEGIEKLNEEMNRQQVDDENTIKDYILSRKEAGYKNNREALNPLERIITEYSKELLRGYASQLIKNQEQEKERLSNINPSISDISTTSEGFVFEFNGKLYKFTGTFAPLNRYKNEVKPISESKLSENIQYRLMLYPGSFKPPHRGHVELVKKYANKVNKLIILISSKPRNGANGVQVDAQLSKDIWDKYLDKLGLTDRVVTEITDGSPVVRAYDYISQKAPSGSTVYLLKSDKDGNDKRFGIENSRQDVKVKIVVAENIDSLSSTDFRDAIGNRDLETMSTFLPDFIKFKDMFSESILERVENYQRQPVRIDELESIDSVIEEVIRKHGSKYCLHSKRTNKNLGCYPTKSGAKKRERQVQYFKSIKEDGVANSMGAGGIQGFAAKAFSDED